MYGRLKRIHWTRDGVRIVAPLYRAYISNLFSGRGRLSHLHEPNFVESRLGCLLSSNKSSRKSHSKDSRHQTDCSITCCLPPNQDYRWSRRHHSVQDRENPNHSSCVSLASSRENTNNTTKSSDTSHFCTSFATYSLSTPLSLHLSFPNVNPPSSHNNPNTFKVFSTSTFFRLPSTPCLPRDL